eukprot:gene36483-biopygen7062
MARQLMILLFATVSALPRAVECTVVEAGKVLQNLRNEKITTSTIRQILSNAINAIRERYPDIEKSDLCPTLMRSILFRTRIPLTEERETFIESGLLINSLHPLTAHAGVIPETNFMSAYLYGNYGRQTYSHTQILSSITSELFGLFGVDMHPNETVTDVGKYREVIATGVTSLRLWTSYDVARQENKVVKFTLRELLQLYDRTVGNCRNINWNLGLKLSMSPTCLAADLKLFLPPWHSNTPPHPLGHETLERIHASRFFAQMNDKFWGDGEVVKLSSMEGECFDAGWLLPPLHTPTKPMALLLDCKAGVGTTATPSQDTKRTNRGDSFRVFGYNDLPDQGKKAEYFTNIIAIAKSEVDAGNITLTPGSLLEALVEGRYLYVYLDSTSDQDESITVGDNILFLRGVDSKRYLSFFYDFFRLLSGGDARSKVVGSPA